MKGWNWLESLRLLRASLKSQGGPVTFSRSHEVLSFVERAASSGSCARGVNCPYEPSDYQRIRNYEMQMKVPFLDLKSHHAPLRSEIDDAIQEVIDEARFRRRAVCRLNLKRISQRTAIVRIAIGVGSGTEALWLSLLALGVGPGDDVITVPNSFMATAEAITYCGAKPVFVDVDERTYTMDPSALAEGCYGQDQGHHSSPPLWPAG